MSQAPPPADQGRSSQIDRRWALVAVVLVVILLVVGVGVYAVLPTGSAAPSSSPGDQSAYAQLFGQVGPNGEVTEQMALEAFSVAIAPLPGVTVPSGPPPNDEERMDGTFAANWIYPYLNQLTPDQLAVVNSAFAPDPTAPVQSPQTSTQDQLDLRLATFTQSDLTYYADQARQAYTGKLHRSLAVDWSVTVNKTNVQVNGVDAWAYTIPAPEVKAGSDCVIHVNPNLVNNTDQVLVEVVMAHEMFHCFQADWLIKLGKEDTVIPNWLIEGGANWAAEAVAGPTPYGSIGWGDYLTHPEYVLWSESYNAIGFYQHMQEEGIDPFGKFDAMLTAFTSASPGSANGDAFKAAGAAADNFLDTWASGYFRDSSEGVAWYASGPWTVTSKAEVDVVAIHPGDSKTASAQPATNAVWSIASASDIIEVRGQNHVRMHIGQLPELPVDQRWICTKDGGCKCPPGQSYSGPELENPGVVSGGGLPGIDFGITGSLGGASVTVIGHSLDEFCKPTPSPPPVCQSNCGNSNGDPHLRTINRYGYDFQGAGEFVLLRNADDSVEVQARQEPYTQSTFFHGVSTNTALAVKDNGHKVSIYATSSGLVLHVDGQQVDPSSAPDLGAGASVKPIKKGIEIDVPDGTVVSALSVGQWGINVVVQSSPSMLAQGVGLLGPITPGFMGVPALPDGTQLPAAPNTEARDQVLYGQFADAWRVTDSTTLFDYDPGKSTESYTDKTFPSDADRQALEAALASPDPNQQAAAQSACAAITDPDLRDECEYDVFATGDAGFAEQYQVEQDLFDSGIVPPTGPPTLAPASSPTMSGATSVLETTNVAGSAIGPDDTVYLSYDDAAGASHLAAIDPQTAAVKMTVDTRRSTDIHFVDGSIWASGEHLDSNNQDCNVTRYDPSTLAEQSTFNIPCSFNYPGPQLESTGDAVWFIDTTKMDPNSFAGVQLTRIDPSTNAPSSSVPLPSTDGCCQSSQGALFCFCGNDDVWRLTSDGSALEDLGNYSSFVPAGTGFWTELEDGSGNAGYIDAPGGPSATVPLNDGRVIAGDANNVYIQADSTGETTGYPLLRQATDGSAPVQLATSPVWDAEDIVSMTTLDYLTGNPIKFIAPDGFVTLWNFQGAEWLQWAPLP